MLSFVYPRFIGRALCRVGSTSWRIMGRNKTTRPVYGASFHKESNDEAVRFGATGSPNGPRNRRKLSGSLRSLEKFEMALVFLVVLSNQWKEVIKVETSQQNCNSVKVGLSRYDLFFCHKKVDLIASPGLVADPLKQKWTRRKKIFVCKRILRSHWFVSTSF